MDQAENLRNIIKKQNQKDLSNARVIAVTSGKGGVGKSSVSINLAVQFTQMGKKVIILDADFGLANIEVMFGVIPKYNLSDLMVSGREISEIITEGPEGIKFISGGSGIAKLVNPDKEQVKRLVNKMSELENMADVIIIDTGAGISSTVMEFLVASPETIIVTTPEPTSITDSYALLKALSMNDNFRREDVSIKMIANRVSTESEGRNLYEKLNMVVSKFLDIDMTYLGIIPMDNNIVKAVMVRTGANAKAGAQKALDEAQISLDEIKTITATGYGRKNIDFANDDVTEITCHARGARFLYPEARYIIDIGGQDSKFITLDENGNVASFVMNDKCAAGTGRFLENMAKALEISMEQMANDGLKYSEDISISNMCTVFAESEVISLISENKKIADIIHGLNKSVAIKTKALASKALGADGVMMTGGVANNKGVVTELEKQLNTKIFISDKPEFCGAIGAGLFAVDSDR